MKDRIKYVREKLGLSQREFGERLGVSRDVISNVEYGRVQPKDLFIQHLCEKYHVSEEWLRSGEGTAFTEDPAESAVTAEAMKLFRSLRPEFQTYALEQIRQLLDLQEK